MKNKIIILTLVLVIAMSTMVFAKVITPEVITFSDVPLNHWAVEHIYDAQTRGIINGYPDGTFAPEANVAVGEFIKMVAVTYYKDYKYTAPTDGSHWAMPYVNSLHRVVLNKANYDYETLERTITRAEASRILCMLYITTHNVDLDTTYSLVGSFADEAAITDKTDRLAVDNCVRFGLINGHAEDNTFRPLEGLTRCQAAKILCLADNK